MFIKRGRPIGCPLLVELSEKLSQILGKGIHLKTKNCIKVSKIFREWGML